MTKHIANILTSCRILGSVLLLFIPAFSLGFYIIYFFCGLSDMLDGTIARKTNTVSSFGSKLDTAADFVFMTICALKLLPLFKRTIMSSKMTDEEQNLIGIFYFITFTKWNITSGPSFGSWSSSSGISCLG